MMPDPSPDDPPARPPDDTTLPGGGRGDLYRLLGGLDRLELLSRLPDRTDAREGTEVRVARYRARWRIGSGRFGLVYAADDADLGRLVVLKVPQAAVLTDPGLRERFVREARAAARLDHPGVVPVLDAGEDGGLPYLVAGLVDGPTLAEWMARHPGPSDPRTAAELVARLAAAVQHAHERGVLHCDLKPANVLLDRPGPAEDGVSGVGVPRVTDFGLARLLEDDPALTRTVQVAGTPLYMAPEQARGDRRNLTARADVYSLGAILYELLTGRPPFVGVSDAEVMARLLNEPAVPPHRLNARISRDLDAVCLKCLEKRPEDRYPTAAALADDLARYRSGEPTAARPLGPAGQIWRFARRRPATAALAAVALLALAAIPAVAIWYSDRLQDESDARHVAEAEAAAGDFVAVLEQVRQRRLERPPGWAAENLAAVRRAADLPLAGRYEAGLRTEAIAALTAVDPGPPRILAPGFNAYAAAFSPDGRLLALGGWLPNGAGHCEVKVLDPGREGAVRTLTYPADADWEKRYRRTNTDGCRSLAFSPDGKRLALGTRSGWVVFWDLTATVPVPDRWRHADPAASPRDDRVNRLAFSRSGRVLVSSDGERVRGWDAARKWARAFEVRGTTFAELARPARTGDPLQVSADDGLYAVTEDPPAASRQSGTSAGHRPAAGLGGKLTVGEYERSDTLYPLATETGTRLPPLTLPGDSRTEDDSITDALFDPTGTLLATSAEHIGQLKLWCVTTGRLLADRVIGGDNSLGLAFAPNGRLLAVCAERGALLYDLPAPAAVEDVALQPHPLGDAAASATGDVVVTDSVGPSEEVRTTVWDAAPGSRPVHSDLTPGPTRNNRRLVAVSADGRTVANTTAAAVRVRNDLSGAGRLLPVDANNVRELRFGPDGRLWLVGDTGVVVWPAGDGPPHTYPFPDPREDDSFRCTAPGRGAVLAGGSDGRVVRLNQAAAATYPTLEADVTALTLSPDEQLAAAGHAGGGVVVFRVATGEVVARLPDAHRNAVEAIAFGPGGWFVTGSRDRSVKVWDAAGRAVLTLPHARPVSRVFVSADGRSLTTLADGERALRRWRLDRLRAGLADLGLDPGLN
jgi:WD40 repeat protein